MVEQKGEKGDIVDRLVAWGCGVLHIRRQTKFFQQLAKFLIVGVTNTALNFLIYYLVGSIGVNPLIASAVAFGLSSIFNFWASTTWVFDTTKERTRRRLFIEFIALSGLAFLLFDELLLGLLIDRAGWNWLLAKVLTTAVGMVFNFITRKIFLEGKRPRVSKKS